MNPVVRDGTLGGLDALDADSLVVPLPAGVRPPTGVAGRVDWRLGGRLSRLVLDGKLSGAKGELSLLDSGGAIGPRRVFVVGVGEGEQLAATLVAAVSAVVEAGAQRVAFAPLADLPADQGALAWAEAVAASGVALEHWGVLDPDGTLFRSADAVAAAAQRLGG